MLIIFLSVLPKLWHVQYHWDWLPYMPSGYINDPGQDDNVLNRVYHAGGAQARLHAHGVGQGTVSAHGHLAPRPAQRHASDRPLRGVLSFEF